MLSEMDGNNQWPTALTAHTMKGFLKMSIDW